METSDWPPSNYPIFFALVLLVATAVTLAMGDETRAENLAIYAYYLLVIGVTVRFFELALPDGTLEKLRLAKSRFMGLLGELHLSEGKFEGEKVADEKLKGKEVARRRITGKKSAPCKGTFLNKQGAFNGFKKCLPELISKRGPAFKKSHLKSMADVSKDVTVYLSVFFVILAVYGLFFGWWIVWGYLEKITLIAGGFLAVYILLRIVLNSGEK